MATLMKFTKTIMKNLFSKPVTTNYPAEPAKFQERTRGQIKIDMDKCVLCTLCALRCPANAIKVDRNAKTWEIERFGCVQCGYCINSCAKQALSMDPHYTEPGAIKTIDVFRKAIEETNQEKEKKAEA